MNKPKNRKEVIKLLKNNGFELVSQNKHEKWINGDKIVMLPNSHKEFHVISHWQILKRVGLV